MFVPGTSAMAASNAGAAAVWAGSPAVSSSGSRLSDAQRTSPKFIGSRPTSVMDDYYITGVVKGGEKMGHPLRRLPHGPDVKNQPRGHPDRGSLALGLRCCVF